VTGVLKTWQFIPFILRIKVTLFPITAKLNPLRPANLPYLATSAIIARIGVAAIRVNENKPSKNENPELTRNEKRQALLERFFVEGVGTFLFTVVPLHLGQDLMNKAVEKTAKALTIPQMREHRAVSTEEREQINQAILKVFGRQKEGEHGFTADSTGLISRMLFGKPITLPDGKKGSIRASLSSLRKELGDPLYGKALEHLPELTKFSMHLNRYGCLSLMAGVLFSATLGGVVTQRLNDTVVAPAAKSWLNKQFPDGSKKPGRQLNGLSSSEGNDKNQKIAAKKSSKLHHLKPEHSMLPKSYINQSMGNDSDSHSNPMAFSGAAYPLQERREKA
jgi:hypothetical protein